MEESKDIQISMAPIQGVTDYVFRNYFHKHFSGIDSYFAPYIRIDKEIYFRKSKLKDILPENNGQIPLIPQIMVNNSRDFLFLDNYLFDLGYLEINWNLGCPYPMVTNRQLGAALLADHERVIKILDEVTLQLKTKISIKMRSGLTNNLEIEKLLPKINTYPLTEVIIHPRYAKQLYKAKADIELFIKCIPLSEHKLCYNGDIDSLITFNNYHLKFSIINSYMIGRGIISNPFLAAEIKSGKRIDSSDKLQVFKNFHSELFDAYFEKLNDKNHVLSRMKAMWLYFSNSFTNEKKVFKRIKKATTIEKFELELGSIFRDEEWIA